MASIKVFARLKPCLTNRGSIRREDQTLFIGQQAGQKSSENSNVDDNCHNTQSLRFGFAHILDVDSTQNSVYETVAKDIVRAFLEGYNGTIFAYGQAGSGKTFTIHGADGHGCGNCGKRSENAGLIPRCLSSVLKEAHIGQNEMFSIQVSFLGIYKETAYDLLGTLLYRGQNGKDLPKVLVTLGAGGSCHLHGLSAHLVNSEEDALKLYYLGVANRQTTQIPSNEMLSRSHTIFTITLRQQKPGSDIITRSKLHLVDLAGSERVWKSRVHGQCLAEAKFVNMSLHHLESVITALQQFSIRNQSKKKQTEKSLRHCASAVFSKSSCLDCVCLPSTNIRHMSASVSELRQTKPAMLTLDHDVPYVPYRNSLLTMVLQDSLGGNCSTAMIATLSLEEENIHETISTCRFAQRVARIVNKPVFNEEVDKNAVIKRLQTKLGKLHLELATFKAAENEFQLIHGDRNESFVDEQVCANVMDCFLIGRIKDPVTHGINTPRKFRASLRYLRNMILESQSAAKALRPGDEVLESSDDRDSGVRTNSEPTSPLTSEGESDGILASNFVVPSTVLSAAETAHGSCFSQDRGILVTSDYDQLASSLDQPFPVRSKIPQLRGPERSEASTQTEVSTSFLDSSRGNALADVVIDRLEWEEPEAVPGKDLMVWEKQLKKEALMDKSKVLTSRLADQRARLVVMTRQGAFPEEVENEKIVEMHLLKKQRMVEHELFTVIKQLAEQKDTNRHQLSHEKQLREQRREQRPGTDAAVGPSQTKTNHRAGLAAQMAKQLELKERSTRQKLLAGRELMKNYTITASKPPCKILSRPCLSASNRRFRTCQTSYSSSSSIKLQEDEERVHGSKCSKSSNSSKIVFKKSPQNVVSACSTFSLKGKLELKLTNTDRRGTFDINRNCHLIEYIHNSHQSLYRKSTFPRQSDGSFVTRSVKVQTTDKEERFRTTETVNRLCVSEYSGSVLDENVSKSSLRVCTGDSAESTGRHVGENKKEELIPENKLANSHTPLQRETQSRCEETDFHKDELPGCKVKERTHSRLFYSRKQQERVEKIRQCVNAAEVIQLSWRRYKRCKNRGSIVQQ